MIIRAQKEPRSYCFSCYVLCCRDTKSYGGVVIVCVIEKPISPVSRFHWIVFLSIPPKLVLCFSVYTQQRKIGAAESGTNVSCNIRSTTRCIVSLEQSFSCCLRNRSTIHSWVPLLLLGIYLMLLSAYMPDCMTDLTRMSTSLTGQP